MIGDYGISNSTLEEVFLHITATDRPDVAQLMELQKKGNEAFNENDDDDDEDNAKHFIQNLCVLCCEQEATAVTGYTKCRVPFLVDGLICLECAEGTNPTTKYMIPEGEEGYDPEAVKAHLAKQNAAAGKVEEPEEASEDEDPDSPEASKKSGGAAAGGAAAGGGALVGGAIAVSGDDEGDENVGTGNVDTSGAEGEPKSATDGKVAPSPDSHEQQEPATNGGSPLAVDAGNGGSKKKKSGRNPFLQFSAIVQKNFTTQTKQTRSNMCRAYCVGYCTFCGWFCITIIPVGLMNAASMLIELREYQKENLFFPFAYSAKNFFLEAAAQHSYLQFEIMGLMRELSGVGNRHLARHENYYDLADPYYIVPDEIKEALANPQEGTFSDAYEKSEQPKMVNGKKVKSRKLISLKNMATQGEELYYLNEFENEAGEGDE
jgi:hypothetical protein